jgi:hypothetical protein
MYVVLERLVECIPFEVLDQERDRVGVGPCLGAVVAWSQSVRVVCLIDKGVLPKERPEQPAGMEQRLS